MATKLIIAEAKYNKQKAEDEEPCNDPDCEVCCNMRESCNHEHDEEEDYEG